MSDSRPTGTTSSAPDAADGRDADFEPSAEPDDTCFVVLDPEYLRELLAVYQPTEGNSLFFVREGVGIRARSRSEFCYWFEVTIPIDVFDAFDAADADLWVDVDALERAVDRTRTDRIALRGKADGSVVLQDGRTTYQLQAAQIPLEDTGQRREASRFASRSWFDELSNLEFTVPGAKLQALVGADEQRDHAAITADADAETVEVFFFDANGTDRTVSLRLDSDDLVSPPASPLEDAHASVATAPICRNAIDQAVSPMRGDVTLNVPKYPDVLPTQIRYERANGALSVCADVVHVKGAHETLMSLDSVK